MTMTHKAIVRRPGEGIAIGVVGDVYRCLATGEETDGKYAMFDALVPPGGGPPPHVHTREEESFYVLEGEVTFLIGDQRVVATAGMFANVSTGCLHAFRNESDKPARMIITVAPAGLEKMFLEVGHPVSSTATEAPRPTQADIDKLLAIAPSYGIEIRVPGH